MEAESEVSAITHLYAGVPVTDLEASIDWYTRLCGHDPDVRAGQEILWEIGDAIAFAEPPDST